jgi:hypothetical protein
MERFNVQTFEGFGDDAQRRRSFKADIIEWLETVEEHG